MFIVLSEKIKLGINREKDFYFTSIELSNFLSIHLGEIQRPFILR